MRASNAHPKKICQQSVKEPNPLQGMRLLRRCLSKEHQSISVTGLYAQCGGALCASVCCFWATRAVVRNNEPVDADP